MDHRTIKRTIGRLQDMLVKVVSFIYLAYIVIVYRDVEFEVPIIIGRPFLSRGRALVDMKKGQMKFKLNKQEVSFNICRSISRVVRSNWYLLYDIDLIVVVAVLEEVEPL